MARTLHARRHWDPFALQPDRAKLIHENRPNLPDPVQVLRGAFNIDGLFQQCGGLGATGVDIIDYPLFFYREGLTVCRSYKLKAQEDSERDLDVIYSHFFVRKRGAGEDPRTLQ
jgi:hypothetical protein